MTWIVLSLELTDAFLIVGSFQTDFLYPLLCFYIFFSCNSILLVAAEPNMEWVSVKKNIKDLFIVQLSYT